MGTAGVNLREIFQEHLRGLRVLGTLTTCENTCSNSRPEPRFVVEGVGPAAKRMRKDPPRTSAEAERNTRAKNPTPTPTKIVPDAENFAVQWYGMLLACPAHERQALLVHNAFMRWRGVGSLIAERDALRQALTRVLTWAPKSTEAACEQDFEFARNTLAKPRT